MATAASFLELVGLHLPGRSGDADLPEISRADFLASVGGTAVELISRTAAGAELLRGPEILKRWNFATSGSAGIAQMIAEAHLYPDGAFAIITRADTGRPRNPLEIIIPPRGMVQVQYDPLHGLPSYSYAGLPISHEDVVHLPPLTGACAFERARRPLALLRAADSFAASIFRNAPGGILNVQGNPGQERLARTLASIRDRRDGNVLALYDGMTFDTATAKGVDAQLVEFRGYQLGEICRACNVNPAIVGDLTRATWANLEQSQRAFIIATVSPWLQALTEELAYKLGAEVAYDLDDFSAADLAARATTISSLIASRVINPNEGRAWLGLAPRDGGDDFANPHTAERTGAAAPQGEDAEAAESEDEA